MHLLTETVFCLPLDPVPDPRGFADDRLKTPDYSQATTEWDPYNLLQSQLVYDLQSIAYAQQQDTTETTPAESTQNMAV